MRQDIIDLYDDYTHARLDRRVFMDRLAALAGGAAAASALLPLLRCNYAQAAIPGLSSPLLQFVNGNLQTLEMELFLDSYEEHRLGAQLLILAAALRPAAVQQAPILAYVQPRSE